MPNLATNAQNIICQQKDVIDGVNGLNVRKVHTKNIHADQQS